MDEAWEPTKKHSSIGNIGILGRKTKFSISIVIKGL
jgi:hypothetical protein